VSKSRRGWGATGFGPFGGDARGHVHNQDGCID